MGRDDAVVLLYSCLLAGVVIAVHCDYRRRIAVLQRDVKVLQGSVQELSRGMQDLKAALVFSSQRTHVVLTPLADVSPNDRMRWSLPPGDWSEVLVLSEDSERVEVRRDGVYLVAVRCRYTSTPSELPRLLALLLNGVVVVQYAAPKHGCFGPTETLALREGDTICVEYFGGITSGDHLECGSIDMTFVLL